MRALFWLLILACAFGAAALWQEQRTSRLREERVLAAEIADGRSAMTPSGPLGPGEAMVVIGGPAGGGPEAAPPVAPPPQTQPDAKQPAAPTVPNPTAPAQPAADTVVEVKAGQTLSKIARDHYGTAPVALVNKLAQYNGMADANALRAGMQLKLPAIESFGLAPKK